MKYRQRTGDRFVKRGLAMPKITPGILVLALFVATTARGQDFLRADAAHPEVSASGRGEVQISPTRAAVSVTVSTKGRTAAEAASLNAGRVASTRAALRATGLTEAELRNVGYSVSPNYERRPEPEGFIARYTIRAETARLDDVGRLIDAALSGGATEVSSVQFFAPNSDDARRAAMAIAVRAARQDAEAIARAAGGSLGRLITITSSSGNPPGVYAGGVALLASSAAVPTYLPPSDLTITASAIGRWEFIPAATR